MKKTGLLLTVAGALLIASSNIAVAKTDAARDRLNNFFTKVSSLKGSFNQQVFSKKGKMIQSSTGNLYLSRPGKFRWVYKTPDPQIIVGDGKNIWIYDEDLEQVTIKPLSRAMSSAPIAILTRKQSPDAQFVVKSLKAKGGLDWFQLTPRKASKDFRNIEIGLDAKGNMRQMIMLDQLGQKTVIKLNTQSNVPIAGKTFFFKPPAGVDVIGKAI
ncbi:MAG: outer membrane lipoprotein chaperone LolA [Cocleimonas sp.]|nr:outer membrane lipoprotein chaperone LolA [Cocleimonas sp.]